MTTLRDPFEQLHTKTVKTKTGEISIRVMRAAAEMGIERSSGLEVDIARVEGPERIAPEWWRSPSSARLRDYYRVEDTNGRRYWIYREGLTGDGRGGLPNWFIHGLFG